MNIIFTGISGYQYPHTRVRCFNFAKELSQRNFSTEVLSFHDHLAPKLTEEEMFSINDFKKILLSIKAMFFIIKRRKSIIYIQKIHYHAAIPVLLARLRLFKIVLDLDDWDEFCHSLFGASILNFLFFGKKDYRSIVEKTAKLSKFCVVSSHSLLEIVQKSQTNTFLVPTGVDTNRFTYIKREKHDTITCCWTGLVWGETVLASVLKMIESFANAQSQVEKLRLLIVGTGSHINVVKDYLNKKYDKLPVEILNWIHPDNMVNILHKCDIGLLPFENNSIDDLWIKSKSPTKLFEYLATGLPTVATAKGEVNHVIENGRNGFLTANWDDFTNRIIQLATDYDLRISMGEEANMLVEQKFNLTILGNKLKKIFNTLKNGI